MSLSNQKKCSYCGKFFRPHPRVGNRQKSCKQLTCQKKRKLAQQARWREHNPDYFKGRYNYLKEWRQKNPHYQKNYRMDKIPLEIQALVSDVTPIVSTRLNIRTNRPSCEIQTLVLSLVKSGQRLWVHGAWMHPG